MHLKSGVFSLDMSIYMMDHPDLTAANFMEYPSVLKWLKAYNVKFSLLTE